MDARRGFVVAVGSALLALSGCTSNPAAVVVPKVAYEREGQSKARTAATSSRPLVIEWPAAERARLESSSKRGLVVVRYDDSTMEVLSRCSAPGAYAYTATTPQREGVHIRDEDELRANLPLGAAALSSRLARSGELTVELSVVGTYESGAEIPARGDLVGDCVGATHVVVALTTGAFQFYSGGSADVGAAAQALGAGAGARSNARRELLSEGGDAEACKTSGAADVAPPFGCGALLRVEVERLPPWGRAPGAPAPTQPDHEPSSTRPAGPQRAAPLVPPSATSTSPPQPSASPPHDSSGMPLPVAAVLLGLLLTSSVAGIVAGVALSDSTPEKEPAAARLGKAGVSAPSPASGTWRF